MRGKERTQTKLIDSQKNIKTLKLTVRRCSLDCTNDLYIYVHSVVKRNYGLSLLLLLTFNRVQYLLSFTSLNYGSATSLFGFPRLRLKFYFFWPAMKTDKLKSRGVSGNFDELTTLTKLWQLLLFQVKYLQFHKMHHPTCFHIPTLSSAYVLRSHIATTLKQGSMQSKRCSEFQFCQRDLFMQVTALPLRVKPMIPTSRADALLSILLYSLMLQFCHSTLTLPHLAVVNFCFATT